MLSLVLLVNILVFIITVPVAKYNGWFGYEKSPKLIVQHTIPLLSASNAEQFSENEVPSWIAPLSATEYLLEDVHEHDSPVTEFFPPPSPVLHANVFVIVLIFGILVMINWIITFIVEDNAREKNTCYVPLLPDKRNNKEMESYHPSSMESDMAVADQLRDLKKTVEKLISQQKAKDIKENHFRKETKELITIFRDLAEEHNSRIKKLSLRMTNIEEKLMNLSMVFEIDRTGFLTWD